MSDSCSVIRDSKVQESRKGDNGYVRSASIGNRRCMAWRVHSQRIHRCADSGWTWLALQLTSQIVTPCVEDDTMVSSQDMAKLRLFRARVEELFESGLVRSGITELSLKVSKGTLTYSGYDEDHYKSFIMTIRQFKMSGDDVNVDVICSIILAHCSDPQQRAWVQYSRDAWKKILSTDVAIILTGKRLTLNEAIELDWYGAGRFHSKAHKTQAFDSIPEPLRLHIKMEIQNALLHLMHMLANIDIILDVWLDSGTSVIPPPPTGP